MASSSTSPCAACKFLRRKCTPECVFAPYFPPDQPQKFVNVHKIFGASNVSKLLNELPPHQREDAVNSLAYEADARVKDPVYGCVGAISLLQQKIAQLQTELALARSELSRYASAGLLTGPPGGVAAIQQATPSLGIGMGLPGPSAREQLFAREQQTLENLTREQMMEYARATAGGSYNEGFAALGLTGGFVSPQHPNYPSSRHDTAGSSDSAGAQTGHFKMEPSS